MNWKFWKKKEPDFGLDNPGFGDAGMPEQQGAGDSLGLTQQQPAGLEPPHETQPGPEAVQAGADYSRPQAFQEMQQQTGITPDMIAKDLALISSKLDTVRSQLENMNQRISNLEKIASAETTREW